jgi:hypothetical protein
MRALIVLGMGHLQRKRPGTTQKRKEKKKAAEKQNIKNQLC